MTQLLGPVIQPARSLDSAFRLRQQARHWLAKGGKYVRFPADTGHARALVLAESGAGKTQFLAELMQAAHAQGARTTFIDCKGDPRDARKIAPKIGAQVHSTYNVFRGDGATIGDRLFRAWPETGSAADFYRNRAKRAFEEVQVNDPAKSLDDVLERLRTPGKHSTPDGCEWLTRGREPVSELASDDLRNRFRRLARMMSQDGWSWDDEQQARVMPLKPGARPEEKQVGDVVLDDLRRYLGRRMDEGITTPEIVVVDEFAQLVDENSDPADVAASLFETARSAGLGLVLVAQSVAGLSTDENRRKRVLSSGVSIIAGRGSDPEEISNLSGTHERMEASGDAQGAGLGSGRSQHAYNLPPEYLRGASMGAWFLVQAGSVTPFRAWAAR